MKKVLFVLLVLFMELGIVSAATGIKPAFKSYDEYNSKMTVVTGIDMRNDIAAFVGEGPDGKWGLYVYEGDKLLYSKEASDGYYYNGVTILDDYVLAYGTDGKYTNSFSDSIHSYYVYDMEGNLVEKFVGKSCPSNSTDPCTSTGFSGKVINAGNNMFAFWYAEDVSYFDTAPEGQTHRMMYDLFKVDKTGISDIADETKTNFDTFIIENNEDVPYVEAIYVNGNVRALVGDNRVYGTAEKRHLVVYEGSQKLFDTDEGIEYDDNVTIKDVTVLNSHVVVLAVTDNRGNIFVYSLDGKLISNTQLTELGTYKLAGAGNIYAYNGEDAGELLRAAIHYTLDMDIKVDGYFDLYLANFPSLEGDRLAYLYPGDEVVVAIKHDFDTEIAELSIDGEKITCVTDDDMSRCPFTMPEKNAKLVVHTRKIPYEILEGANPVYNNKNKKVVIRSEGPLELFESVTVNGVALVKDKDYTVKGGSTIVTLNASYLKTLKNGNYELSINFTNGRASSTTLQVLNNPNTVDIIITIIAVTLTSLLLMVFIKQVRIKKYN